MENDLILNMKYIVYITVNVINNKIYVTNTYPYVLGTIYANRFHEQYENNYEKLKEANDILKVEGQDKLESFLVGEIDNLDDLVAPINKKVMKRR